jgi:hypothetical protein
MAKTAISKSNQNPDNDEAGESAAHSQPTQEEIAVRAYHIYLERGEAEGNPTDDWLQAERDLTEGR